MPYDPGYNPNNLPRNELDLEHFMKVARAQIGDKYEFGAEADGNPDPESFDSSELVEWAAHEAGVADMPDGSWNQYRYLADKGAGVTVDQALHTKGALVFGFSSDPMASSDRPTRAYVGISLGDGKNVLDVSERGGEVREMPHGGFYNYGAVIPDFHPLDEPVYDPDLEIDGETPVPGDPHWVSEPDPLGIPGGVGWSQPSDQTDQPDPVGPVDPAGPVDPVDPVDPAPARSYSPSGRILHEDLPAPEPNVSYPDPPEPNVSYPDEPLPEDPLPEDQVCWPDDTGPTAQAEPASTYSDSYTDSYTDLSADV